jgi:hypothetical protein
METQLLSTWAKFHKMGNLQKRELFSNLTAERLNRRCEAHIYRVLTRLTFQSLRRKYEVQYRLSAQDALFDGLLYELGLSPSTALNWYYSTLKERHLWLEKGECADLPTGSICECCLSDAVRKRLAESYDLRLVSKRLYQVIVKAELFREELLKKNLVLSDLELCQGLRRIVENDYYVKRHKRSYVLGEVEVKLSGLLVARGIRAITVLKWFYLLKHHPELLVRASTGEITPDDIFDKSSQILMKDLRGDENAD